MQPRSRYQVSGVETIPACAGIGLRSQHYQEMLEQRPKIGWLEAHSENYFGDGGTPLSVLTSLRNDYPLSLHGVGLSLGSTDELNLEHVHRLKRTICRFEPALVSDHLSWSSVDGEFTNDLLPLPYTEEALSLFTDRVRQTQDLLGRALLIENPSSYLCYRHSTIAEWDFLAEIARRADCGLLLDINNIYVSAFNHGFDPLHYLDAIPGHLVGEIHLAGYARKIHDGREILIDDHGSKVSPEVWTLFGHALSKLREVPVLIEWDSQIPPLAVLVDECQRAGQMMEMRRAVPA